MIHETLTRDFEGIGAGLWACPFYVKLQSALQGRTESMVERCACQLIAISP